MDLMTIGTAIGATLGGVGAIVLGVQKAITKFRGEGITLATTNSMKDMVDLLSMQIKELAQTNIELRTEIKLLREQNNQLMAQNLHLQNEVDKLAIKVQALTSAAGGRRSIDGLL